MFNTVLLVAAIGVTQVAGHGFLKTFTLDGTDYEGFERWNNNPDPKAIGWSYTTEDEGPVLDVTSPDMVCRHNAEPSQNYAKVAAGSKASALWTSVDLGRNPDGWAHSGPVITYIAPCDGDCTSVDKTALKWTKIDEKGLMSGTADAQGVWASDVMRENGGVTSFSIPAAIAPGKYVLRHEVIALHRAHIMEPEFYMQCGNVEITGDGSDDLSSSGVVAAQLYSTDDKSIFGFDLWNNGGETTWDIPGPALYSGAPKGNNGGKDNGPVEEEKQDNNNNNNNNNKDDNKDEYEWEYEIPEECKAKKVRRHLVKHKRFTA